MAVRVYLHTFGCRANQYDSETVAAMVVAAGGALVESPDLADVAVFNSCTVTREAEADLRQQIRKAARLQPALQTVVMGCAAARSSHELHALPSVRGVVAGADLPAIGAAIGLAPSASVAAATQQRGTRGLLRIQDGCDEHCTFCATTLARGASRSRTAASILTEATALAAHHAEIVLTGIHIGSYGADIGSSLAALLTTLVDRVPAVRFRLTSVEATEVDPALAELLTGARTRVAPYLHAPLQSGSDPVLRRMGRHWYTARQYASAVESLVARAPVFGLGADLIAGFPGETAADHRATCALVDALPVTSLHVFPYSVRPGTAASRLPGQVSDEQKRERAAELRAIGVRKAAAYRATRVGGSADVIVIGHGDGHRDGLTEDYLPVDLAAPAPARGERFCATLALSPTMRGLVAHPMVPS
jgi:threonylcarbamoyladenosine tRNA methylthiotransferase MtaB